MLNNETLNPSGSDNVKLSGFLTKYAYNVVWVNTYNII